MILFFSLVFSCASVVIIIAQSHLENARSYSHPRWDHNLDHRDIENRLTHEQVTSCIPMQEYLSSIGKISDFDNEVFLVILESGVKAVFKLSECRFAEVAAYKASSILNLHLVPPTVLRIVNGQEGSLQFFVDPDVDLQNEDPDYLSKIIDSKMMDAMRLFYFVFGQWDLNFGNQIVQYNEDRAYLALIDNAGIYDQQQSQYGDFSFVRVAYSDLRNDDWDIPFPFDQAITLENATMDELHEAFKDFFDYEKSLKMWKRYHEQGITYCTWRNCLWIQYYKNDKRMRPCYISHCDSSMLQPYITLNREILETIWSEALQNSDKKQINRLVDLTLQRRDQVLKASAKQVTV